VLFRHNLIANYISQLYATAIGIVMVPLYIQAMGAEAYGLVGFFAMLQAVFALLDLGLTPTLARETARFRGGSVDILDYRRLVRALEGIFVLVAVVAGGLLFAAAGLIATHWLNAAELPLQQVQTSIQLIAVIVAMRWMCGLYRGVISGSEHLVWLSSFNGLIATLRFVAVLPLLILVDALPVTFFQYQLAIAVLELGGLAVQAYRLLPAVPPGEKLAWDWRPLFPVIRFATTIAFTSAVWVVVTQTDKLVLSRILPLADYGYFTLAVLVASGVLVISGPVSLAIMPRMSRLEAEGDHDGVIRIYRQMTQLVTVLAGGAATTLGLMAEPLLWAWTGDAALAARTAPVLMLYALGNGILAVAGFPYYLQYAKGDLRLHLIGNAIFVVVLLPSIIWAASSYGSLGAGYTWLALNALSLVAWLPLVHARFAPGLNAKWYGQDILAIAGPQLAVAYAAGRLPAFPADRLGQFAHVATVGTLVLVSGIAASSNARAVFAQRLRRRSA
jgi:O-antigen/teichoic acid export membrane protein